eukprot:2489087-Amphidinium_carterae.1
MFQVFHQLLKDSRQMLFVLWCAQMFTPPVPLPKPFSIFMESFLLRRRRSSGSSSSSRRVVDE